MTGDQAITTEIVPADAVHEWDTAVDQTSNHDAFHHWAYVTAMASGAPILLVVRSGSEAWMLPLEIEAHDVGPHRGVRTARSVYGYSGPVWTAGWKVGLTPAAWAAVQATLHRLGVVSVLLRLHPTIAPPHAWPAGAAVRNEGEVVLMPLERDETTYWSAMRGGHRKNLRRAIREGLTWSVDDSPAALASFGNLYHATMDRIGARDEYRFGVDQLERLRSSDAFKSYIVAVTDGAALLASGIFLQHKQHAHYFLSGSRPDRQYGSRPTRLMLHHARSILLRDGSTYMNLGGGLGARRDALFEFKSEFSSRTASFNTVRWVVYNDAYIRACSAAGIETVPHPSEGWFPAFLDPRIGPAKAVLPSVSVRDGWRL